MFRIFTLLILALLANFQMAYAESCDFHLSFDKKTVVENWKKFSLTSPDSDVSIQSRPVLVAFYENLLQQKIEERFKNPNDPMVKKLATITIPKLTIHIEEIRAEIYTRFEHDKVLYWGKDDKHYVEEINAIKSYIKILDGYLESYIHMLINEELLYSH